MTKPTIRIQDLDTNEIIDREMTDEEFTQYQADLNLIALEKAAEEARLIEKAALLERLNITSEEAKLLLS